MDILAQLNSCVGNAYLEMGDLNKAQAHHELDYEIGDKKYVLTSTPLPLPITLCLCPTLAAI